MWPELTRIDTIARLEITTPWHYMSNYQYNETYGTLSLFNQTTGSTSLDRLCNEYYKHIDGTVYENLIKVNALNSYLNDKQFNKVFLSWKTPKTNDLVKYLDTVQCLDDWTEEHNMRIPNDGHPTPEAHLQWSRSQLIPYLLEKNLISIL
jgi:hypothetical protein